MSKTVMVTGGAMSGKSRYAVTAFECCDEVRYLCTRPNLDEATKQRILFNESRRNFRWHIEENFRPDLLECEGRTNAIFDSLSDLVFASMYEYPYLLEDDDDTENLINNTILSVKGMADKVKSSGGNLVIITQEVSCCPEHENETDAKYVRILSAVNQRIASICDEVYVMISGIPVKIR